MKDILTIEQLRMRQAYPLDLKIRLSERRIREWYDYHDGNVSVSFSGGKDSTVLLHLVRSFYPDVPAVFVDTGLEFPEIRSFVRSVKNVIWLKPEMRFDDVIKKYGYPVVSKKQAQYIKEVQRTEKESVRRLRLEGIRKSGKFSAMSKISNRWQFLCDAPFKVSEKCCEVMKKKPIDNFIRESGKFPYVGTMASEGGNREKNFLMMGCNAYDTKRPQSKPLSFWMESDIWEYLNTFKVPYSTIYDKGYVRTGCVFCAFGAHLEKGINRFQRMKLTHPKLHSYCMSPTGLDMERVLNFCGVKTGCKGVEVQKDMFDPDPLTLIEVQTDITEYCQGIKIGGAA